MIVRQEGWQCVHFHELELKLAAHYNHVLDKGDAFPGRAHHVPLVLQDARLDCEQAREAAFLEVAQVGSVRLRSFRKNQELVEARILLHKLLSLNN